MKNSSFVELSSHSLTHSLTIILLLLINLLLFNQCANEPPTEANELLKSTKEDNGLNLSMTGDSTKTKEKDKEKDKDKGGEIVPEALETGWKYETELIFDHYSAKQGLEFGIAPDSSQQYNSTIIEELHSYWGFNYVAIMIGNPTTVANAQNSFGINHTMAIVEANSAGRNAVEFNTNNGLPQSTFFWAYYTDEPGTVQCLSSYGLDSFENFVLEKRPYSLFGFGEVTRQEIGNYITNTITNSLGETYPNPYPVNPDFVMCTKYDGDNIPRWDLIKNLTNKFNRTWIHNQNDLGEFNTVLNYLKNNTISPWLYVKTMDEQNRVRNIWDYCNAAYQQGFLDRFYKQYRVLFKCNLNHVHDPSSPWLCYWVEYNRTLIGIIQY